MDTGDSNLYISNLAMSKALGTVRGWKEREGERDSLSMSKELPIGEGYGDSWSANGRGEGRGQFVNEQRPKKGSV